MDDNTEILRLLTEDPDFPFVRAAFWEQVDNDLAWDEMDWMD